MLLQISTQYCTKAVHWAGTSFFWKHLKFHFCTVRNTAAMKNTIFSKCSSHHSIITIIPSSDSSCFNLTRYVSSLEGFALINFFRLTWSTFKPLEISLWKMFCKAAYPKWLHSRVWNSNLIYCKWLETKRCRSFFLIYLREYRGRGLIFQFLCNANGFIQEMSCK